MSLISFTIIIFPKLNLFIKMNCISYSFQRNNLPSKMVEAVEEILSNCDSDFEPYEMRDTIRNVL